MEKVNLGHINDNIIEFHGEVFKALSSDREAYETSEGDNIFHYLFVP